MTLALGAAAEGAPLDRRVVPAEAAAVIHIDLEAVWKSRLFGEQEPLIKEAVRAQGASAAIVYSALRGAEAVTVWLDASGETGTTVIRGLGTGQLVRLLELAPSHESWRIRGWTWHRFQVDGTATHMSVSGPWIVVGDDRRAVDRTVAAIEGRAPRVSKKKLGAAAPGGTFLFAVLGGEISEHVKQHASSTVLEKGDFEAARLWLGERGGDFFATAEVVMGDTSAATEVRKILDGMLALGSLASDHEEVQALVRRFSIDQRGSSLSVKLQLPTDKALELLKNAR